jgi:guanylate kinase
MTGDIPHQLVLIVHGPGGAGKDAVVDELRDRLGFVRPTSSTSRPMRDDEVNGDHYHFYAHEAFQQLIDAGAFIEWADVQDYRKGIERDKFLPLLESGRDLVIRTDVQGAKMWKRMLDGAVSILLRPESPERLEAQLHQRGDSEQEIAVRLREYPADVAPGPHNDYTVVNLFGQLDNTVRVVAAIARFERFNPDRPRVRLRAE